MRRNALFWALWLAAAALLWLFENNAATLAILLVSLLLPCLSVASARRAAKRASLRVETPERAAQGSAASVTLRLRTPGGLAHAAGRVLTENRLTGERRETPFLLSGRAGGETSLSLAADTARCGTLRLRTQAYTEDLFGLWRSGALPCAEDFLTVEPALFPIRISLTDSAAAVQESERYSRTRPGNDPSETFALREYQPGDPVRQIHWKLSQKTDKLMLRELGLPVTNRTLLVFRNVRSAGETVPPETADAMAAVFLSLSHALLDEGVSHTAAFAEGGQFLLTEVHSEFDFAAMQARFLTLGWEADDGALDRLRAEAPFAHVAVVGPGAVNDTPFQTERVAASFPYFSF